MSRPPLPPFNENTAPQKVRAPEDAWNTRDLATIVLAYTPNYIWRNRTEFPCGRAEIEAFLIRKWRRELDYRLMKELWGFRGNRMAVRFASSTTTTASGSELTVMRIGSSTPLA